MSQELNNIGITSFYIDGNMSDVEKYTILKLFENKENSVLCSVKILQEGISLNFVDSVYFVDSKSSEIDTIQCVGRALRKYEGKNIASILVPQNMFEYTTLLRTLITFDPKIKSNLKNKFICIGYNSEESNQNLNRNLEIVNYIMYDRKDAIWQMKYNLCLEYEKLYGGIMVRTEYKDIKIGYWISNQRRGLMGAQGVKITEDRKIKLNQLECIKNWEPNNEKWEMTYQLCLEYEKFGGKIIHNTKYKGESIGQWISDRKRRTNGPRNVKLVEDRRIKLNQLECIKNWKPRLTNGLSFDEKWEVAYQLCLEYEKSGEKIVHKTEYKNIKIGNWIDMMKQGLNGKGSSKITEDRKIKLNQLDCIKKWSKNNVQSENILDQKPEENKTKRVRLIVKNDKLIN